MIDRVSPVVDGGSGTFRVVTRFKGGEGLRPGMFGRIEVVYDSRTDALTVPRTGAAGRRRRNRRLRRARQARPCAWVVEVGYLSGELAEVRKGLKEGEQVVTAGKITLRDGATVEVLNPEPGGATDVDARQGGQPGRDALPDEPGRNLRPPSRDHPGWSRSRSSCSARSPTARCP